MKKGAMNQDPVVIEQAEITGWGTIPKRCLARWPRQARGLHPNIEFGRRGRFACMTARLLKLAATSRPPPLEKLLADSRAKVNFLVEVFRCDAGDKDI